MKIGLLFYDDDPKARIEEKVRRAAARYQEKYGHPATACFVHPSMLAAGDVLIAGVDVSANRAVLPNHLWLGVGEPRAQAAPQAPAVPPPAPEDVVQRGRARARKSNGRQKAVGAAA